MKTDTAVFELGFQVTGTQCGMSENAINRILDSMLPPGKPSVWRSILNHFDLSDHEHLGGQIAALVSCVKRGELDSALCTISYLLEMCERKQTKRDKKLFGRN